MGLTFTRRTKYTHFACNMKCVYSVYTILVCLEYLVRDVLSGVSEHLEGHRTTILSCFMTVNAASKENDINTYYMYLKMLLLCFSLFVIITTTATMKIFTIFNLCIYFTPDSSAFSFTDLFCHFT